MLSCPNLAEISIYRKKTQSSSRMPFTIKNLAPNHQKSLFLKENKNLTAMNNFLSFKIVLKNTFKPYRLGMIARKKNLKQSLKIQSTNLLVHFLRILQ